MLEVGFQGKVSGCADGVQVLPAASISYYSQAYSPLTGPYLQTGTLTLQMAQSRYYPKV